MNKNKVLSYCEALRYMQNVIENNEKVVPRYIKLTNPPLFQTRFPKSGPIYRWQPNTARTIGCKAWNSPVEYPTVYPKKYAHGFVVLCFVVVMQSFIMNSHHNELPQCQWSKPDGYGKISQCITTTNHSKTVTVCIFLGVYCSRKSKHAKVCAGNMFNPVFRGNVQGRKHPRGCAFSESETTESLNV